MRASAKNKRKLTLITLVLALGVAVYLNWEYAKNDDGFQVLDGATEVGTTAEGISFETLPDDTVTDVLETSVTADNQSDVTDSLPDKNYGDSQLVSATKSTGDKFFDEARLTRSKTRDEALDKLQKSLKSANLTDEEKKSLTDNLTAVLQSITKESDVENLVKAKGFADCVAFIDSDKVNVTVKTSGEPLNATTVAQIRDIVIGKVKTDAKNITIVEVK